MALNLGGRRFGSRARLVVGVVISLVFAALTVSRLDLAELRVAFGRVDAWWLAAGVGIVGVDLLTRAARWQLILRPLAALPLRDAAAYLSIGYFANSVLPARLGDVARAYLAGGAFGLPRLTVLGTIVVERLADGLLILGVVATLTLALLGGGTLLATAGALLVAALAAAVGAGAALWLLRRAGSGPLRDRIRAWIDRVIGGAMVVRSPGGLVRVVAITVVAFGWAVLLFLTVCRAAGVELSVAQAALAMGAVALSLSIPAAPGSIGTYEFVGVTVLAAFGVPAEPALVVVVLVHVVATLPLALLGLAMAWQRHIRIGDLGREGDLPANGSLGA